MFHPASHGLPDQGSVSGFGLLTETPSASALAAPQSAESMDFRKWLPWFIGSSVLVGVGIALWGAYKRPSQVTPNRATGKFAGLGEIIEVGKGGKKRRLGHRTPPKKYRKMGATKPEHYAWPEGFMYPIHDATHVRAAASRFGKHKSSYPTEMRQTIAKRINEAKKKFGIGGKPIRA